MSRSYVKLYPADDCDGATADLLARKLRAAITTMNDMVAHLAKLEHHIAADKTFGPTTLEDWKARERKWLIKALDARQRDTLDDPYHVSEEDRTFSRVVSYTCSCS